VICTMRNGRHGSGCVSPQPRRSTGRRVRDAGSAPPSATRTISRRGRREVATERPITPIGIRSSQVSAESTPAASTAQKPSRTGKSASRNGRERAPRATKACAGTLTAQRKARVRRRARTSEAKWMPVTANA
jgi:hypothetical protein